MNQENKDGWVATAKVTTRQTSRTKSAIHYFTKPTFGIFALGVASGVTSLLNTHAVKTSNPIIWVAVTALYALEKFVADATGPKHTIIKIGE